MLYILSNYKHSYQNVKVKGLFHAIGMKIAIPLIDTGKIICKMLYKKIHAKIVEKLYSGMLYSFHAIDSDGLFNVVMVVRGSPW